MANPRNSKAVPPDVIGKFQHKLPYSTYSERMGVNASGLKDLLKSPGHYRALSLAPNEPSDAMRKGSLLHALLLEPERQCDVQAKEVFLPGDDGKGEPERYTRTAYDQARAMADGILRNEVARQLLAKGQSEVSLWWHDPTHNLLCKGRMDFVSQAVVGKPLALDIKSARDNDERSFARDSVTYRYDLQAAHYCEGGRETGLYQHNAFAFVVVESKPPYHCIVYFVGEDADGNYKHDDGFLSTGSQWREYAMRLYGRCMERGQWPFPEARRLRLPGWAPAPQDLIDRKELEDV